MRGCPASLILGISEAGQPRIADPGDRLVRRAKQTGIIIEAISGPCSMVLALMLSGLPGQRFAFHGYLPRDIAKRKKMIRQLERESHERQMSQLFIETPYRNAATLEVLLETLNPKTSLCLAWNLTSPEERVLTHTVAAWKKNPLPNLEKKPTIFLFYHVSTHSFIKRRIG